MPSVTPFLKLSSQCNMDLRLFPKDLETKIYYLPFVFLLFVFFCLFYFPRAVKNKGESSKL